MAPQGGLFANWGFHMLCKEPELPLEAQLPTYWGPVIGSLYKLILSITQEPTICVPGLLGYHQQRHRRKVPKPIDSAIDPQWNSESSKVFRRNNGGALLFRLNSKLARQPLPSGSHVEGYQNCKHSLGLRAGACMIRI